MQQQQLPRDVQRRVHLHVPLQLRLRDVASLLPLEDRGHQQVIRLPHAAPRPVAHLPVAAAIRLVDQPPVALLEVREQAAQAAVVQAPRGALAFKQETEAFQGLLKPLKI